MLNVPQITTVPDAIDALVTAFSGIASDPNYEPLQVHDGPRFQTQAGNMIAVGVGNPSVNHRLVSQNRGNAYNESFEVTCLLWAWSGVKIMKQHRDRCTTLLTAVRAAVDALVLGSNRSARLGDSLEWTQGVSGKGASCSVQFTVHFVASI